MVVDDEDQFRRFMLQFLRSHDFEVSECSSGAELHQKFSLSPPEVVLLDLRLHDADGLDLLPIIKRHWPAVEVIILSGFATIDAAVKATKLGAYDFQRKPLEGDALLVSISRALEHKALRAETHSLREALASIRGSTTPVFQSASMQKIMNTVARIAPSDAPVLITGESGTGKEVIADLIHAMGQRNHGPFIKVNCAALPRELIESELFGSVKGAFTGAQSDRDGLFRQAQDGTLLLDEIAEMPIETQAKLLRVLQEKEFRPVGGRTNIQTDCRIISSTNRVIDNALNEGKLRQDLYYRISAISIHISPLRERRDDILPLAQSFLRRFSAQAGQVILGFTSEASNYLYEYDWPGNVRQLQNEIQRAVLVCDSQYLGVHDFSISESNDTNRENLSLMQAMERKAIIQALAETQGNKFHAARILGIGRQTLYNKLKSYSIKS